MHIIQWEDYYLQKVNTARKTEVDKERLELVSKIAGFMMIFVAPEFWYFSACSLFAVRISI